MTFLVGADVIVTALGRKRGVIVEVGRDGYRVRVENLTIWCRQGDLAEAPRRERPKGRPRVSRGGHDAATPGTVQPARVDLHGFTVEDALARIDDEINRAVMNGISRVEVVHGKGSGRIRNALHRHLRSLAVVASFRLDPVNAGITWIYL